LSQGWPTLIYLTSAAFLSYEERQKELNMNAFQQVIYGQVMLPHEAAHQWWGDLVGWRSYRDQWLVEALADYSAMMLLELKHPENVQFVLEAYRRDLLFKNEAGHRYAEAGPVSLGYRLSSSVFPNGYIVISYGRGCWLMHMLRSLFRDYAVEAGLPSSKGDEAFRNALRSLREHYAHTNITVRELQKEMEAHIGQVTTPASPVKHSLGWFFDGWVNGTAVPKITLKDIKSRQVGKQTFVNFTIVQEECPDTLMTEVPIYAVDANNKYKFLRRAMADGLETKARLAVPAGTRRLAVDPEWTLLTSNPSR
jgi:aminopeptidase N